MPPRPRHLSGLSCYRGELRKASGGPDPHGAAPLLVHPASRLSERRNARPDGDMEPPHWARKLYLKLERMLFNEVTVSKAAGGDVRSS